MPPASIPLADAAPSTAPDPTAGWADIVANRDLAALEAKLASDGASLWAPSLWAKTHPMDKKPEHPLREAAAGGWVDGARKILESAAGPLSEALGEEGARWRASLAWSVAAGAIRRKDEGAWAVVAPFLGKKSRGAFASPGEEPKIEGHMGFGHGPLPLVHLAAVEGFAPAVKTLIALGEAKRRLRANSMGIPMNLTPLMAAAASDQLEAVALLAPKSDIDARAEGGRTALMQAAAHSMAGKAIAWLATAERARQRDKQGRTALMLAAQSGGAQSARALAGLSSLKARDHKKETAASLCVARATKASALADQDSAEAVRILGVLGQAGWRFAPRDEKSFPLLGRALRAGAWGAADWLAAHCPLAAMAQEETRQAILENIERLPRFAAWKQAQEIAAEANEAQRRAAGGASANGGPAGQKGVPGAAGRARPRL